MLHLIFDPLNFRQSFLLDMLLHVGLYAFVKPGHFCAGKSEDRLTFLFTIKFKKLTNQRTAQQDQHLRCCSTISVLF